MVVNALRLRLFTNNSFAIVPKRILGARVSIFGLRYYFVIRHSSFVIHIMR